MTRLQRIVFVARGEQIWGAELSLLNICSEARSAGAVVRVITTPGSPLLSEFAGLGIECCVWDAPRRTFSTAHPLAGATMPSILQEVVGILRGSLALRPLLRDADSVVAFEVWDCPSVLLAAVMARRRVVLDLHETFSGKRGNFLFRKIASLFSGFLVTSESVSERSLSVRQRRRAEVVGRPVGSSEPAVQRPVERTTPFVFGIFGQIVPHKGHELVLEAFSRLGDLDCELWIVGVDDQMIDAYAAEIVATSRKLSRVRLIKRTAKPLELMGRCDVVINASEHEAFGRTVIEALAVGAAPLVLGGGGPREIVRMFGIGLCTSRSSESLEIAMRCLVKDETIVDRARRDGPDVAQHNFSNAIIASKYFSALSRFRHAA